MILNNINLLSDKQLSQFGLSETEIKIIRQNSPVESVLNLFGLGIDIEKVRQLLSFGVIGSAFDFPHVPRLDDYTLKEQKAHFTGSPPSVTCQEASIEPPYLSGPDGAFLFPGFLFPGDITPLEGSVIGPINDCTTTVKKFKVDGKGLGRSVQPLIPVPHPQLVQQEKRRAEDEAARRAKTKFYSALDQLLQQCPCVDPECIPKSTTIGPRTRIVNPNDPPGRAGLFQRSAVATGRVEIACLRLV